VRPPYKSPQGLLAQVPAIGVAHRVDQPCTLASNSAKLNLTGQIGLVTGAQSTPGLGHLASLLPAVGWEAVVGGSPGRGVPPEGGLATPLPLAATAVRDAITGPALPVGACVRPWVKRRAPPSIHPRYVSLLDRVARHVIPVPGIVGIIPDPMRPEQPPPDAMSASGDACGGLGLLWRNVAGGVGGTPRWGLRSGWIGGTPLSGLPPYVARGSSQGKSAGRCLRYHIYDDEAMGAGHRGDGVRYPGQDARRARGRG
jgi:hypothetical protein